MGEYIGEPETRPEGHYNVCGVLWPSGLVLWICLLMAESSECGSNPAATVVLMSLSKMSKTLYHNCFSPPRSKWVPVMAKVGRYVWYSPMRRNGSNWAVYYPGSSDGFRNDLCAWWAGVIMLSAVIPPKRCDAFIIIIIITMYMEAQGTLCNYKG